MIGHDSIGKFEVAPRTEMKTCCVCGKEVQLCIRYTSPAMNISEYVRKAPSFLLKTGNARRWVRTIGVTCGCYAKVHRQIVHIEKTQSVIGKGAYKK